MSKVSPRLPAHAGRRTQSRRCRSAYSQPVDARLVVVRQVPPVLAMPGFWWVRVLAGIGLVCTARHLFVVAVQLVVELRRLVYIPAGYVTLSQRLALVFEFRVGQRAEATEATRDGVEDALALMLSHRGLQPRRCPPIPPRRHAKTPGSRPAAGITAPPPLLPIRRCGWRAAARRCRSARRRGSPSGGGCTGFRRG